MGIITALFQFIIGAILAVTAYVFSAFAWAIPDTVKDSITWYFLQLNYFRGVFPVETLLQVIGTMFLIWGYVYALKLFLHFILPLVPWIGRYVSFPEHNPHGNSASQAIHERLRFRKMMKGKDRINTR